MTTMNKDEKKKLINRTINKYVKSTKRQVNIGFVNVNELTFLKTPFSTFNNMMGGGFPRGKFGVFAGPERTAKSTFLLQCIAFNQAEDPNFVALWTDAEDSLEISWCEALGVDLDRLVIQRAPEDHDLQSMEELLEEGLTLVKTQAIDFWVIDSIGALTPSAELKKEIIEGKMLDLQRKFGEFFRKAINYISPKKNDGQENSQFLGCATVFIGQVYTVPDAHVKFEEVRGGNAVKHWAYWRIRTRRGAKKAYIGEDVDYTVPGIEITKKVQSGWAQYLKLDKTKMNDQEAREIVLHFKYGRGLDAAHCAISSMIANDIFEKGGAWFNHELLPGGKICGKDALFELLTQDKELRNKFVHLLDNKLNNTDIINDNNSDTESVSSNGETERE